MLPEPFLLIKSHPFHSLLKYTLRSRNLELDIQKIFFPPFPKKKKTPPKLTPVIEDIENVRDSESSPLLFLQYERMSLPNLPSLRGKSSMQMPMNGILVEN